MEEKLLKYKRRSFNLKIFAVHLIVFFSFYLILDKILNLPEYFTNSVYQKEILVIPILYYFAIAAVLVFIVEFLFQKILMKKINRFIDGKYKKDDKKFIAELRRECMKAPYRFISIQIALSVVLFVVSLIMLFFVVRMFIPNFDKMNVSIVRVELLVTAGWLLLTVFEYILMQSYANNILFASYEDNRFYVRNDRTISNSNSILLQIIPIIITIFIIFANFSYTNTIEAYSKAISSYYSINMGVLNYDEVEELVPSQVLGDVIENVAVWEKDNSYFVVDWDGNLIEQKKGAVSDFMLKYMGKFYYYSIDEKGKTFIDMQKESSRIYGNFGTDEHAFIKMIRDNYGRKLFVGVKYYAGYEEGFKTLMYSSVLMMAIYSIIIVYWAKSNVANMKKIEKNMKEILLEKDILKKNFMPVLSNDELGNISYYYNKIQEKIVMQNDIMLKQEQLSALGELAGGMAHDINTPISSINTSILMLEKSVTTDRDKDILDNMKIATERIINIVNSMRNQIRNLGSNEKEKFSLNAMVDDLHVLTQNEQKKRGCTFESELKEEIEIYGEKTKLGQVLTNIVVNGIQAYGQQEKKGTVKLTAYKKDKNICRIEIADEAGGIPEKLQKFLFKNITTTKGANGTGLGLYLANSVITGIYKGKIWFDVKPGVGTTFIIEIPMNEED